MRINLARSGRTVTGREHLFVPCSRIGAKPHHQPAQKIGLQLGVSRTRLPYGLVAPFGPVDFNHAAMADVIFRSRHLRRLSRGAYGTCRVPASNTGYRAGAQARCRMTVLADLGAILGPVGFHHARILGRSMLNHMKPFFCQNSLTVCQISFGLGAAPPSSVDDPARSIRASLTAGNTPLAKRASRRHDCFRPLAVAVTARTIARHVAKRSSRAGGGQVGRYSQAKARCWA